MQEVHEGALAKMRRSGGRWAVYQNQALDSENAGHLQFLKFGAGCTYGRPPVRYPADTTAGMGWRYLLVGEIDLELGALKKIDESQL